MQPIGRLYATAQRAPNATAIGGQQPMTYRELGEAVDRVAAQLQALDATPASRVGICAKNTVEHLVALLATYRAGKVWVPLNPRNGLAALDAMIEVTNPSIIVADLSCLDRFTPVDVPTIVANAPTDSARQPTIRAMMSSGPATRAEVERDAGEPQAIKFSGGSTGAPKAVVQSLRCINAQADGILAFFEFRGDDVNLIAAPLTHGASCFVLPIFAAGGRHVLLEDPTPAAILEAIDREGVTTIYAPPTMIYGMLGAVPSRKVFPTLRHLIYSAAPMSPERIRACQRVFGPIVETAYGQVEAPQIVTAMRAADLMDERNLQSVGRPSSVAAVRIRGPGRTMPDGEVGEIEVSGPLLMNGYLGRPDLTSATIVDGWLRTGDTGMIDDRGYLFIRGRLTELINTGGFKVYPAEVEAVLSQHAAVKECVVFGVPDERWGEAVTAAVVLVPGASVDSAQLIAYTRTVLGSVKAPKSIRFVDELPRNPAGKVSRADLKS